MAGIMRDPYVNDVVYFMPAAKKSKLPRIHHTVGIKATCIFSPTSKEPTLLNRSATKRAAMLDAGIAELAEHGLAGASMEAIATGAGVSKRTLYKHFSSKQAVLEAVLVLMIERVDPLSRLHYDSSREFAEQLREVGQREMQLICDPDFIRLSRVLMVECMRSEVQSHQLMQRFGEKENSLYHWFHEAGLAGKLGTLDSRVAADTFVAVLKSPTYWFSVIAWAPSPKKAVQARLIDEACLTLLGRLRQ
jgi:TetR/AcrR family transcriptional regulator of autoinduction and epiphytic fitness